MFSNTMIEEAKKDLEAVMLSDTVKVSVRVTKRGGYFLPDVHGSGTVEATFRTMDYGSYRGIEQESAEPIETELGQQMESNFNEMRRLILRRMLLSWSLDISLDFDENGWLTDECFKKVVSAPAPLVAAILTKYENTIYIDNDEMKTIDMQAAVLFSKNSRGVTNACEAVRLYCVLHEFWEKFGLNRFDLTKLPYRDFLMLRIMSKKDSDAKAAEIRGREKMKHSRMIGPKGRAVPRGTEIRIPG